jgi:hypothetical protein
MNAENSLTNDDAGSVIPAHAAPNQRRALDKGLAALETVAHLWGAEIDLGTIASGISHITNATVRERQIADLAKLAFSEGAYRHYLDEYQRPRTEPYANLEGLADALLAPRQIVRDDQGFLTHPLMPVCDENVRLDRLLAVFGIETAFASIDAAAVAGSIKDRWYDAHDYAEWIPAAPAGEGWMLLEIYETEDDVFAMFGRRLAVPKVGSLRER